MTHGSQFERPGLARAGRIALAGLCFGVVGALSSAPMGHSAAAQGGVSVSNAANAAAAIGAKVAGMQANIAAASQNAIGTAISHDTASEGTGTNSAGADLASANDVGVSLAGPGGNSAAADVSAAAGVSATASEANTPILDTPVLDSVLRPISTK